MNLIETNVIVDKSTLLFRFFVEAWLHNSPEQTQKSADLIPLNAGEFSTHCPSVYLLPAIQLRIVALIPLITINR